MVSCYSSSTKILGKMVVVVLGTGKYSLLSEANSFASYEQESGEVKRVWCLSTTEEDFLNSLLFLQSLS